MRGWTAFLPAGDGLGDLKMQDGEVYVCKPKTIWTEEISRFGFWSYRFEEKKILNKTAMQIENGIYFSVFILFFIQNARMMRLNVPWERVGASGRRMLEEGASRERAGQFVFIFTFSVAKFLKDCCYEHSDCDEGFD